VPPNAWTETPPAAWFTYTPDRKGKHPSEHLRDFKGILQADGYAGFDRLFNPADPNHPIKEAACWAHARRKFYDIHVATKSPLAEEALQRIGDLYAVEESIRGQSPDLRRRARQARAGPKLAELNAWFIATLKKVPKKSEIAGAIRYAPSRWDALVRYRDDGRVEIDNNTVERALRAVAIGRKNYLFVTADVILTPSAEVKLTPPGRGCGLLGRGDVDSGASSGSESVGPPRRQGEGDREGARDLEEHGEAVSAGSAGRAIQAACAAAAQA
jgi:hypothetical protein